MKSSDRFIAIGAAALLLAVAVYLMTSSSPEESPTLPAPVDHDPPPVTIERPVPPDLPEEEMTVQEDIALPDVPVPDRVLDEVTEAPDLLEIDAPWEEIEVEPGPMIRVPIDEAIASVNGSPVLLEHLVPLRQEDLEEGGRAMDPAEFTARLERAIEMELVFQEALSAGAELAPHQQERVDAIRARHEDSIAEFAARGAMWSSINEAQIEFEARLTQSILLQHNLLQMRGIEPSPTGEDQQVLLGELRSQANVEVLLAPDEP
jgi:hypothetical protein